MNDATVAACAWALIHFLWQGAAVALAAGIAGNALRGARPGVRYLVLCGALGTMLLLPLVTFAVIRLPQAPAQAYAASVPARFAAVAQAEPTGAALAALPTPEAPEWIAWLVRCWLAGIVILGVRSAGGWVLALRLKSRMATPAAPAFQRVAVSLCGRLGIRRAVRVLSTAAAEVPATLGWLRPVVLLPLSAVTRLTSEQIELLIAHELAHVRRHDYLVNLVQTAVETVLFYHPAVWWLSGRIRAEREHCCDDLAVAACGNVAGYVTALATLETLRGSRVALAVAADGGSVLDRIQRLLGRERSSHPGPPAWLGALLPMALVLAVIVPAVLPPVAMSAPVAQASASSGFLGGLTEAGYPKLSVDQIIALKEHGVEPRYVKQMMAAGLGVPSVEQVIRLRGHGVAPEFVAGMVRSKLVSDLDFDTVVPLRENDVRGDDMATIRALGFGPFTSGEVIRLRQHGTDAASFEALKEAGAPRAGVQDALVFRENDVTVERIRDMKRQGFVNLSLEQIVKLRRAGVI